ncbi:FAD-binding protein [Streptomyces violaceoruber]
MTRPPAGTPYWDAAELPTQPQLHGVVTADVAVVGAGLAGLSCAYHLAERAPGSTSRWWTPSTRPPAPAAGAPVCWAPGRPRGRPRGAPLRPADGAQDAPGQ